MFYIDGNIFPTTYFKVLNFIKRSDLNLKFDSSSERFSIKDFLVDSSANLLVDSIM